VSFRYEILRETGHRPWPMPGSPWIMTQTWHDLLFAHWPVDPGRVRARVPPELSLDVWDGRAWIGVVPFRMTNVAPRGVRLPAVVSAFPELNVRTYVTHREKPGVYFFIDIRFAGRKENTDGNFNILFYWRRAALKVDRQAGLGIRAVISTIDDPVLIAVKGTALGVNSHSRGGSRAFVVFVDNTVFIAVQGCGNEGGRHDY
jgi:uncharacterized protein YqjF (DUF2071 family)